MSFGKPVGADDVDDEDAVGYFPVEGDMEAAQAGAKRVALVAHGGYARKKYENPVPVEKVGIRLRFAEMQIGIFVDA